MAIPMNVDEDLLIYIVEISMGSQFRGKSKDIDEYTREIKYKHHRDIRREIGAIRQSVNVVVAGTCMKFHKKIKFTNKAGMESIQRACAEADQSMKKIDPTLHVTPLFFPQTATQITTSNMFEQMRAELQKQVYERALYRIEQVVKDNPDGKMTKKTQDALLRMFEKMEAINVLNDSSVTASIETMKSQVVGNALIALRDDVLSQLDESAEALELIDPTAEAGQPEQTTVHDPDENEYAPKPVVLPTHDIDLLEAEGD